MVPSARARAVDLPRSLTHVGNRPPQVHPGFLDPTVENLELLQSMFSSLSFQDGFGPSQSSKPGQHLVEQLAPLFSQIAVKYSTNTKVSRSVMVCETKANFESHFHKFRVARGYSSPISHLKVVNSLAECLRKAVPVLETTERCPLLKQMLRLCCELQKAAPNAAVMECATSVRIWNYRRFKCCTHFN